MSVSALTKFDPGREEAELSEYLGSAFERSRLERYQATLDEEFAACGDEARFYRTSNAYLYNLTAFAMTGTKLPYLEALMRRLHSGSRLLDYGCGIGSDGLLLLEAGYRVEFADYDNPSTAYLRWRLARRGLTAPVHDLDREVPAGFDGAYSFDVIEHVPDPFRFLSELEARSRVIAVNLLEPQPGEQDLHHALPIKDLLRHVRARRLLNYEILHGRSHLVLYEGSRGTALGRMRGTARIAGGQLRRAARRRFTRRQGGG